MTNLHVMWKLRPDGRGLAVLPTPMVSVPRWARLARVGRVLVKMESERGLGSFKSLGGAYAALRLLSDLSGVPFHQVAGRRAPLHRLPRLICASDGNHGLAVAAGAEAAGAAATIYLHHTVNPIRSARIKQTGADIIWVEGTYDDAVDAALAAATAGLGVLVPDTSDRLDDQAVAYVMEGYSVLPAEMVQQFVELNLSPTHLFIQAGVGGLAAALALGLAQSGDPSPTLVVVEPETAACVAQALRSSAIPRIAGDLRTAAEMLACGVASAPAVAVLRAHGAASMTVSEGQLAQAVEHAEAELGVSTTPSGAAGLAGLLATAGDPDYGAQLRLSESSTVALVLSEGIQS